MPAPPRVDDWIEIATASGSVVPARWYPADGSGALLLQPALGVSAAYYQAFAQALADLGVAVLLMEQRGRGASPYRASHRCNWGFREWLEDDLPAAMDWLEQRVPGPPILGGHSLGGHISVTATARFPDRVAGLVLIACANPHFRHYAFPLSLQIRMLLGMLPLTRLVLGHFPGHWIGFAAREASGVMRDWGHLARHGRYRIEGVDLDLEAGISTFSGPVLALSFAADRFGPPASIRGVTSKLTRATVTERKLTEAELGCKADHFSWAKKPGSTAAAVAAWRDRAR